MVADYGFTGFNGRNGFAQKVDFDMKDWGLSN